MISIKANQARYLPMIKEAARDYQLETAVLHALLLRDGFRMRECE